MNSPLHPPNVFCPSCLSVSLNLCLPESCLVNLHLSLTEVFVLYVLSITKTITLGRNEGYFIEIFNGFTRNFSHWLQLTQITNSITSIIVYQAVPKFCNICGGYSFIRLLSAYVLFPANDSQNTHALLWVRGMGDYTI